MDRQQLAYLLIILMGCAIAFLAVFKWHHSHGRTTQRRLRKEGADYDRRMAERMERPSD